jgi:hypothetical protein
MDDREIFQNINRLVDEEHGLWNRGAEHPLSKEERDRLHSLQVALDQCWDLLRQRRARRQAGQDPDTAKVRDPNTVERYLQ